jgi:hypothetical protein
MYVRGFAANERTNEKQSEKGNEDKMKMQLKTFFSIESESFALLSPPKRSPRNLFTEHNNNISSSRAMSGGSRERAK